MMRTNPNGPAAQVLRHIITRPLTRHELAGLMGLGYTAIVAHVMRLQAIRAIEHAGNVRSPSGCGWVQSFKARPDAWAIFEAARLGDTPPATTPARLQVLAMMPTTSPAVAEVTGRTGSNARKVLRDMLAHGLVVRSDTIPAVYSATDLGLAMLAGGV